MANENDYIRWFENLGSGDTAVVGGKNASLGEMIRELKGAGPRVPGGFATTAKAYWAFVESAEIRQDIESALEKLQDESASLQETGRSIRKLFRKAELPDDFTAEIRQAYRELGERSGGSDIAVAVRSSATAEDLPEASFAGQLESFLNISGEENLLEACRRCYASLFTDRAISYRKEHGFRHMQVALSIGVQKMVRADLAGAGVMFSIDTETGFPDVVVIDAAWGLGETVVQGTVTPDEYRVFTPLLNDETLVPIIEKTIGSKARKAVYANGADDPIENVEISEDERSDCVLGDGEILQLARWAATIERHYGRPMDIEWAKDGESGELFVVQARPETVQSRQEPGSLKSYRLLEKGEALLSGLAIGQAIASGKACVIENADQIEQFKEGAVLVTGMTDPDWVPVMKQASGIVTDYGGRTSHAAIVSRELGIPAVVGSGNATETLQEGQMVTLSCAEGETGTVYDGELEFEAQEISLEDVPETKTRIMMNIASPSAALRWWRLPCRGIGLARMEFIINNVIQIHPLALVHFDELEDDQARERIEALTRAYEDKPRYFVDTLAMGIAQIAAAQYPDPVIVRMSDFKSNEYADLIGGKAFEPEEANPMLGFRGASRYYSERYRAGFALECRALKKARETIGLTNVIVMIPFCRTPEEADRVLQEMAGNGLVRGEGGLQIYMMVEIPSNVVLAEEFAQRFDGFSIGSNDLTQLMLGVDRDSELLKSLFDERSEAVKRPIRDLIRTAHDCGTPVGICGEAPSNFPDFAAFLVEQGIDSISLSPDSVIEVTRRVAEVEKRLRAQQESA